MSTEAIDRLHAFREAGNFANSAAAFQKVTQISDTLLNRISPYFKFPEWSKNQNVRNPVISKDNRQKPRGNSAFKGESTVRSDLNTATATDLQKISGIGEKLAARIINFREQLNGFLVEEQLYDVYGLEPVVVKKTLAKFTVINAPDIEKINVTWASYNELRNLLYINDKFAKSILEYRNKNTFNSLSALKHLDGFPEGRFESLKLYLTF